MANNKYFTANEIYARLISSYRTKGKEISPVMVMRWCSELITDILTDPVGLVKNNKYKCTVSDKRALLPADIFRVETFYDSNMNVLKNDFIYQGQYIFLPDNYSEAVIYIDYFSLAVDEKGFPYIKRGYEAAAYAYCVYKMFEEDATTIPPRIAQWRWLQICQDKDWEIEAASRSWQDVDESMIKEIHAILIDPMYMQRYNPERLDEIGNKTSKRTL